jgi:hypothetical protein
MEWNPSAARNASKRRASALLAWFSVRCAAPLVACLGSLALLIAGCGGNGGQSSGNRSAGRQSPDATSSATPAGQPAKGKCVQPTPELTDAMSAYLGVRRRELSNVRYLRLAATPRPPFAVMRQRGVILVSGRLKTAGRPAQTVTFAVRRRPAASAGKTRRGYRIDDSSSGIAVDAATRRLASAPKTLSAPVRRYALALTKTPEYKRARACVRG